MVFVTNFGIFGMVFMKFLESDILAMLHLFLPIQESNLCGNL